MASNKDRRLAIYCRDPNYSDRQVWVYRVDSLQNRSSLITVYIICHSFSNFWMHTVMILKFRTDRSGQTVWTQIRGLLEEHSDQGTVCHSVNIIWPHHSVVKPHYPNLRILTAISWVSENLVVSR